MMPASCTQERGSQVLGQAGDGQAGGLDFSSALTLAWWTGSAGTKKTLGSGT